MKPVRAVKAHEGLQGIRHVFFASFFVIASDCGV